MLKTTLGYTKTNLDIATHFAPHRDYASNLTIIMVISLWIMMNITSSS